MTTKTKTTTYSVLALLTLAAAGACAVSEAREVDAGVTTTASVPATDAVLATAIDTLLPTLLPADGVAAPMREAMLSTKLMATVTEVLVHEGDQVRAGQLLARLDARDVTAKAEQVAASVAAAEAGQAQAAANVARMRALFADDAAPKATWASPDGSRGQAVPALQADAAADRRRVAGGGRARHPGHAAGGGTADLGADDRRDRGAARRAARRRWRTCWPAPSSSACSRCPGVEHVYTMAGEGYAMVTVRFKVGEDQERSITKVHAKLACGDGQARRGAAADGQAALDRRRARSSALTLHSRSERWTRTRCGRSRCSSRRRSAPCPTWRRRSVTGGSRGRWRCCSTRRG
jgi:multidrug efflux pump subunit AcrA (membrane-fusion protein)